MKSMRTTETNPVINTRRTLATAGVIAAGLFAGAVQPASAAHCPKPDKAPRVSKRTAERTNKAQQVMNRVARRIVRGPMDRKGGVEYFKDQDGQLIGRASVIVAANGDRITPQTTGSYEFSITAPATAKRNLRLSCTQQVDLKMVGRKEYVTDVALVKNTETGGITFYGQYLPAPPKVPPTSGKGGLVYDIIEASTVAVPHEAHLTEDRIEDVFNQAVGIVEAGTDRDPIKRLNPAFKQPVGTQIHVPK